MMNVRVRGTPAATLQGLEPRSRTYRPLSRRRATPQDLQDAGCSGSQVRPLGVSRRTQVPAGKRRRHLGQTGGCARGAAGTLPRRRGLTCTPTCSSSRTQSAAQPGPHMASPPSAPHARRPSSGPRGEKARLPPGELGRVQDRGMVPSRVSCKWAPGTRSAWSAGAFPSATPPPARGFYCGSAPRGGRSGDRGSAGAVRSTRPHRGRMGEGVGGKAGEDRGGEGEAKGTEEGSRGGRKGSWRGAEREGGGQEGRKGGGKRQGKRGWGRRALRTGRIGMLACPKSDPQRAPRAREGGEGPGDAGQ